MAIYGKLDGKAFANTIAVTNGDATVTKNAADSVEVGDVLDILGVAYIVKTVTSTTSIELHTTYAGSTAASVAAASVLRRTPPRAVAEFVIKGGDTNSYELLFVDDTEKDIAANKGRGITGPGWWQYRTHTDVSGATRHKAECLAFVHASASDATSTNLALTGQTAANDGNQYRVKVTSDNGAPEVISAVATLTFGS
jgi:hypothetical protein